MILSDQPSALRGFDTAVTQTDLPAESHGQDISVTGALLMSAAAVTLAILGMMLLAALVTGGWWLIIHIPMPAFVTHALAAIGL